MKTNATVIIKVPETAVCKSRHDRPLEIHFVPHYGVLAVRSTESTEVYSSLQALVEREGLDLHDIYSWVEWKTPRMIGSISAEVSFFERVFQSAKRTPSMIVLAFSNSENDFSKQAPLLLKTVMSSQLLNDKQVMDCYRTNEGYRRTWKEQLTRRLYQEINP